MTSSASNAPCRNDRCSLSLEAALVLALLMAGAALRFVHADRLAVEHFDEGIYASNIFFGPEDGHAYPSRHLYAPPMLPSIIEWLFVWFGPSDIAAMLPGLVAGSLTVPLMWWIGRAWFGPPAGLMSAALAAFSDAHVIYSRTALVDVLMCFWCYAAAYLLWKAMRSGSLGMSLAAGGVTSLAWWTKYNGWLPLAIALGALCGHEAWPATGPARQDSAGLMLPGQRTHSRRAIVCWGMALAAALLGWLPCLVGLHDLGGYAAVAANHKNYLVGLRGWFDSADQLGRKLAVMEGWPTYASLLVGLAAAWCALEPGQGGSTWNLAGKPGFKPWGIAALGLLVWAVGPTRGMAAASSVALAALAARRWRHARRGCAADALAEWFLASALLGLSLVTPLYTPYPRLALPWLAACWLAMGMAVSRFGLRDDKARAHDREGANPVGGPPEGQVRGMTRWVGAAALGVLVLACAVRGWRAGNKAHESRLMARQVAGWVWDQVRQRLGDGPAGADDRVVIYIYGEPAVLFQLRKLGLSLVKPVQDLGFGRGASGDPRLPTFVLLGPHAFRSAGFAAERAMATRLETVAISRQPAGSLVTRLDQRETIAWDAAGLPRLESRHERFELLIVRGEPSP